MAMRTIAAHRKAFALAMAALLNADFTFAEALPEGALRPVKTWARARR
ncbi:hypothetical protein GCM10010136_29870 [Limoniibacter endophyticus]|uniref:Uncharacterized protein n=1 Tax=Limoniibacter endophyticus TaxID=1565040 RepID=A0A8J3GIF2_9HYPH|nr:hypothetical protein GCM10010136_29870 [Limoniibacter endophyticus]